MNIEQIKNLPDNAEVTILVPVDNGGVPRRTGDVIAVTEMPVADLKELASKAEMYDRMAATRQYWHPDGLTAEQAGTKY